MTAYDLELELTPAVQTGNTEDAIARIECELRKLTDSPFHRVIALSFTNPPEEIGAEIERFPKAERKKYQVRAIYTETNGFAINTSVWFFDLFAYREYQGHNDYDWLANWDSGDSESPTLTGMEELQEIYTDEFGNEWNGASDLCSLMVVAKFQDLIRRAVPHASSLACPILATSHNYDFIAEFNP